MRLLLTLAWSFLRQVHPSVEDARVMCERDAREMPELRINIEACTYMARVNWVDGSLCALRPCEGDCMECVLLDRPAP